VNATTIKRWPIIVLANLAAWVGLVALRAPLPEAFFATKNEWLGPGRFHYSSADPVLVIAGRPLWSWSQYHGGETSVVMALEAVNVPALVVVVLSDAFLGAFGVPRYTRSILAFVCLLVMTTIQWHLVARALSAFRAWRQGDSQTA
jgi:hypothetical protein